MEQMRSRSRSRSAAREYAETENMKDEETKHEGEEPLPKGTVLLLGPCSSATHYKHVEQILRLDNDIVVSLWELRPSAPQFITIFNEQKEIPRKQLAMGRDYAFSGQVSRAVPWHPLVSAVRDFLNATLGVSYNGCLLNFYKGHTEYIGAHSDDEKGLAKGQPIAVVSFGVPRRFRFTAKSYHPDKDIMAAEKEIVIKHGDIVVMHGDIQQTHKHEVRKPLKKGTPVSEYDGKRVSLTFRVFA
jgi:alkylated DNA repair dioxygenase AlkB